MQGGWGVIVEGLQNVQEFDLLKDEIRFNAMQAINRTTAEARTSGARKIMSRINFPPGYLNPAAKRLFVSRKATRTDLESVITARSRPTSLARFVTQRNPDGKTGVKLQVERGRTSSIKRAFLIKLPSGSGPIDTKYNMGLAIRLKKGERLENKTHVRALSKGLYVLYGPSVDQVFLARTGPNADKGVATELEPEIQTDLRTEFLRLMGLRNG